MILKKHYIIALHLVLWIFFSGLVYAYNAITLTYMDSREGTFLSAYVIGTLINAFIFYVNAHAILPSYLSRKTTLKHYIIRISVLFLACSFIEGMTDFVLSKMYYPFLEIQVDFEFFDLNLILNFAVLIISFGYGFAIEWFKSEKKRKQLFEEKIGTELAFLKSQVNPHFLFNTLNNLFAMARKSNDFKTSEGIAKLANLMRYMLYECNVEKVEIEKEVEYLKSFIELNKLRIAKDDDIEITFDIKGNYTKLEIEPMMLVPFVENAFKHGISLKAKSLISISLEINPENIVFDVKNTINKLRKAQNNLASGFGLKNVKRRLELLYPDNHKLTINQTDDLFETHLILYTSKNQNKNHEMLSNR